MSPRSEQCSVVVLLLDEGGTEHERTTLRWSCPPTAAAVIDALARAQLRARRLGLSAHVLHGPPWLATILQLAGLDAVLLPPHP